LRNLQRRSVSNAVSKAAVPDFLKIGTGGFWWASAEYIHDVLNAYGAGQATGWTLGTAVYEVSHCSDPSDDAYELGYRIEDVQAAAGVSASQLYHYFPNKSALIRAVIQFQEEGVVGAQEQALAHIDTLEGLRIWADAVVVSCTAEADVRSALSVVNSLRPTPRCVSTLRQVFNDGLMPSVTSYVRCKILAILSSRLTPTTLP
jgi:hypothetical protein